MERKQLKKNTKTYEDDVCATCKHYSSEGYRITGFCLKQRRAVKAESICGYYTPDVRVRYVEEYKNWVNNW